MIKLTNRLSALTLALMLMLASVSCAFAAHESTAQYAFDEDILSESELEEVKTAFLQASDKTGWQLVLHSDDKYVSAGSLSDYYYEYYYKTGGFEKDAAVLVFNTAMDKGAFFGTGEAEYYFTDDRISETGKLMRSYMNRGDYAGAAEEFADKVVEYKKAGSPALEKKNNKLGYVFGRFGWIIIIVAVVAGIATFAITAGKYKYNGKFNTYSLKDNSKTTLTERHDDFVTKHTTSRVIRTQSSGSSSGGGGGGSGHSGGDF